MKWTIWMFEQKGSFPGKRFLAANPVWIYRSITNCLCVLGCSSHFNTDCVVRSPYKRATDECWVNIGFRGKITLWRSKYNEIKLSPLKKADRKKKSKAWRTIRSSVFAQNLNRARSIYFLSPLNCSLYNFISFSIRFILWSKAESSPVWRVVLRTQSKYAHRWRSFRGARCLRFAKIKSK